MEKLTALEKISMMQKFEGILNHLEKENHITALIVGISESGSCLVIPMAHTITLKELQDITNIITNNEPSKISKVNINTMQNDN